MNPQKIMNSLTLVNLQNLPVALRCVDVFTGKILLKDLYLAYAHYDFFEQSEILTQFVRVYLSEDNKYDPNKYGNFFIVPTDMHHKKFTMIEGLPVEETECMGVSYEWLKKMGVTENYSEACIKELHALKDLDLKPL